MDEGGRGNPEKKITTTFDRVLKILAGDEAVVLQAEAEFDDELAIHVLFRSKDAALVAEEQLVRLGLELNGGGRALVLHVPLQPGERKMWRKKINK